MIGILGGTFDPIHLGHIEPAFDLLRALPLQELRFVLVQIPSHRDLPRASAKHRWRMLELALKGKASLIADDCELRREGPSYTVDTLLDLRAQVGEAQTLCLIMGADAFANFTSWHRWQDILQLANLVVTTRPGAQLPSTGAAAELLSERRCGAAQDLTHVDFGAILLQTVQRLDISATTIREGLAAGRDVSAMLPEAVWRYIHKHGLYGATSSETAI
jgi:nicotinate-nucleotide adenylyltransferase